MRALFVCLAIYLFFLQSTQGTEKTHGIALHHQIKYPKDFQHFEGVNPKAPKGGTLKLGVVGTFDSTNPYIAKGTPPVGLSRYSEALVFEGLMMRSPDEPFTLYAWIAESVEVASDQSWIVFHLNPKARWADGLPVTPQDVIFSHKILKEQGAYNMRTLFSKVETIQQIGQYGVKITLKPQDDKTYNAELPLLIAMMPVLPRHFFAGKDFEKTSLDYVMGSGPYKIKDLKPGHRIIYERRKDYWGADLPLNVGKYNFDFISITYYRERNSALVAFESGEYDYLGNMQSARQHDFRKQTLTDPTLHIIDYEHQRPAPLSTYCLNGRREMFKDRRVREALSYALDFQWLNKNLFHGAYKRNRSFFENTELAHQGLPSPAEYALLQNFKGDLPSEVFEKPYYPAPYEQATSMRQGLKRAAELLKQAGWHINKGVLTHLKTGQVFKFELMLYNKKDEKVALAFARSLKTLGIQMAIRTLDAAQYEMRRLKFDYDMILNAWFAGNSPGAELSFYWGSDMADQEGSRNYPGLKNKAIDFLCQYIAAAKTRADLVTGCHALDRVLMWGHYVIPLYYNSRVFIAHRDTLAHPPVNPHLPILLATWWAVPENEKKK